MRNDNLKPQQKSGNRSIQVGGSISHGGVASSGITVVIHQHAAPVPHAARRRTPTLLPGDVLALMQPLSKADRISVLDFMERQFHTRLVIELNSPALFRLKKYVEAVLKAQDGAR